MPAKGLRFTIRQYLTRDLLKALPNLSLGRSLLGVLGDYFKEDKLKLSFTFQSKYLGMSAWDCPGAFAILPYVEHAFGVYHVMGGLSEISEAMAKVCRELGVNLRLGTPVKQLVLEGRNVRGVELADGEKVFGDETVLNADFGYAMKHLVPPGVLKKYSPENVDAREYSCSTFMLYLGLDKVYDLPHHTIFFAGDYQGNIRDIFQHKVLSEDLSFYVRNASVTDPALAPPGHSAVYVLVPVPNRTAQIDWAKEKSAFRERVIAAMEKRGGMADIREPHPRGNRVHAADVAGHEHPVRRDVQSRALAQPDAVFPPAQQIRGTGQLLSRRRRHASRQRSADDLRIGPHRGEPHRAPLRREVCFQKHAGLTRPAMNWIQFGRLIHSIYGRGGKLPDLDWIQDLGLLAVKLGQVHALRIDFLDREKCEHLARLYRRNATLAPEDFLGLLRASAVPGFFDHFESIEPTALASASVGQVHRARLKDGEDGGHQGHQEGCARAVHRRRCQPQAPVSSGHLSLSQTPPGR